MELRPIPSHGVSGNRLYELVGPGERRVVKVYCGRDARARRQRERRALVLWRKEGFDAPEVFDLELPEVGGPHLVISRVEGRSLREVLREEGADVEGRLRVLGEVLGRMRRRHERAIETGQVALVHPDSSTGNVLLTAEGVLFLDLEARPKIADAREAAAVEVAKLLRWAVRDLGIEHLRPALERLVEAYRDRREILERVVARVLDRPVQFFHRRRDRRRKRARPGEVTKYDIADALAEMLRREGGRRERGGCAPRRAGKPAAPEYKREQGG
jgi:tRNA A-37 threonylcarbamoyl transferase component Bud32